MLSPDEIDWVPGEREHAAALRRFVCAEPERRVYDRQRGKYHPRPWELEVQSGLRGLTPPLSQAEGLLLGLDAEQEIAVATRISFDTDGEQLMILAVATRIDCRGNGLGREALRRSLAVLDATKKENEMDCGVWARIDHRNEPSRRLFAAAGFVNLGLIEPGTLEVWITA